MPRADRWPILVLLAVAASTAAQAPLPVEDALRVLPQAERDAVAERQARLQALSPAERERLAARVRDWDALPPVERKARRASAQAWQALPEAERRRMRAAADAFARLAADEQDALRARFAALDASEQNGWHLGPSLGADYPALHPLLAQVPEHQRLPMIEALRRLTPAARGDLAVLAQRTPPQGRDELRIALLSTAAQQRAAWLRRQVDP
jgi:hypothetical protein